MTTIFEALRDDHDVQRSLARRLVETEGASDERHRLFTDLTAELSAHADNEERHFYIPLMEDDLTQDKARHSIAEHQEMDDLVETLRGYDPSAPQWLVTARELRERLEHHLEEEEHEVFQMAGKVLSDGQKSDLATEYRAAMVASRGD